MLPDLFNTLIPLLKTLVGLFLGYATIVSIASRRPPQCGNDLLEGILLIFVTLGALAFSASQWIPEFRYEPFELLFMGSMIIFVTKNMPHLMKGNGND